MYKLRPDLVVSELGEETLVYDPEEGCAHNLNGEAARLFLQLQDKEQFLETPETEELLQLFVSLGFVKGPGTDSEVGKLTRRKALGLAASATVVSVFLPEPAAAQSGTVTEADCIAGTGCGMMCSGVIGARICGAVMGSADTSCACVPVAVAVCPCT